MGGSSSRATPRTAEVLRRTRPDGLQELRINHTHIDLTDRFDPNAVAPIATEVADTSNSYGSGPGELQSQRHIFRIYQAAKEFIWVRQTATYGIHPGFLGVRVRPSHSPSSELTQSTVQLLPSIR